MVTATGIDVGVANTWGRFIVTPEQVATMYARLQGSPSSRTTLDLMRGTEQAHRFNVDQSWASATQQNPATLAVKTGWDLSLDEPFARTHAVILGPRRSAVVMTATPITDHQRQEWGERLDTLGPIGVLDLHEQWAGNALRDALNAAAATLPRRC